MQTAGNLVGILVELTAGMELGHDDLGGGNAFFFMQLDRESAPVVVTEHEPSAIQTSRSRRQ